MSYIMYDIIMVSQTMILSLVTVHSTFTTPVQHLYITSPNATSQLNSFMCGDLNRTDLLCSKCQHALGPAVLSYRPQCVECLNRWYGWLVYIPQLPCFP